MSEIDNNELFERDEQTGALVQKIINKKSIGMTDQVIVKENKLYKIDEETNAHIPVVDVIGGGGGMIVPDYANMESTNRISANNGEWEADRTGFVKVGGNITATANGGWLSWGVLIDNVEVAHFTEAYMTNGGGSSNYRTIPILKGQTVKIVYVYGNGTVSVSCYFIPPKFVEATTPVIAENFENFMCVPDYANQETINRISTQGGTWTADRTGYVALSAVSTSSDAGVIGHVNEKIVFAGVRQESAVAEVAKGDVVKLGAMTPSNFQSCSCYFIPPKFVKVASPVIELGGDYSFDEQPVLINDGGVIRQKKWIDGKPLYRKVYQGDIANPTSYNQRVLDTISDAEDGFIVLQEFFNGTEWTPERYASSGSEYISFKPSTKQLLFMHNWTGYTKYRVIFQYTKTTD